MDNNHQFPRKSISKEVETTSREIYRTIFGSLLEDDEITPHQIVEEPLLFLGGVNDARDLDKLKKHNIKYVLSMMDDKQGLEYYQNKGVAHEVKWKGIAASDLDDYNMYRHFEETFQFIEEARKENSAVLVHCAAGVSRSATIVCAYLMRSKQMSAKDAVLHVHKKRSCICPNLGFMCQLILFEEELKKKQAENSKEN